MNAAQPLSAVAAEWAAKPSAPNRNGETQGSNSPAFLANSLESSAIAEAEEVHHGLAGFMAGGDRTLDDVAEYITARGIAFMEGMASTMVVAGTDREPWAREAANRAAQAYRDRLGELIATVGVGGTA